MGSNSRGTSNASNLHPTQLVFVCLGQSVSLPVLPVDQEESPQYSGAGMKTQSLVTNQGTAPKGSICIMLTGAKPSSLQQSRSPSLKRRKLLSGRREPLTDVLHQKATGYRPICEEDLEPRATVALVSSQKDKVKAGVSCC